LIFTYLFTILCLYYLNKNYRRFVRARQLFSLELVHSIAARTVMVTELPPHLRGERTLAEYFENMGLSVESVSVVREVTSLKRLLDVRTEALMKLEAEWVKYVGNPSTVESYDPTDNVIAPLVDVEPNSMEAAQPRFVVPHRDRPTMRPGWWKPKVDALDYLDERFKEADEAVRKRRRTGKFKATHVAFVTFEKMSSAQMAVQTAHSSSPFELNTHLAPEPRDIVWTNMTHSPGAVRARELFVFGCMGLLFFFWIFPITALASLLSYREIQRVAPWLGDLIDKSTSVRAIVQNSLPSVGVILLNATLPFLLEGTYTMKIMISGSNLYISVDLCTRLPSTKFD
jgi:calcium permeable stress-gated cation channel